MSAKARPLFRVLTVHEIGWRSVFSFAARTSARYLVSGVFKEKIFRFGDDWGRIDRNEDNIIDRKE